MKDKELDKFKGDPERLIRRIKIWKTSIYQNKDILGMNESHLIGIGRACSEIINFIKEEFGEK